MYKLGIIGGMGPLATAEFYKKIVISEKANKDSDHIDLVILNHASMPDRSECILKGKGEIFLSEIAKDFKILEEIGVKTVAIPCNTSHYFYEDFQKITKLHILNMIEETILEVKKRGFDRAAVFATLGTLNSGLYEKYGQKHGVDILPLPEEEKKKVMDIIYEIKENNKVERKDFISLIKDYCDACTIGIIACTELSLIPIPDFLNTVDALDVLVEKCLQYNLETNLS